MKVEESAQLTLDIAIAFCLQALEVVLQLGSINFMQIIWDRFPIW